MARTDTSVRDDLEMLLSYIREFESADYEDQKESGADVACHPFAIAERIDAQIPHMFVSSGESEIEIQQLSRTQLEEFVSTLFNFVYRDEDGNIDEDNEVNGGDLVDLVVEQFRLLELPR